MAELSVNTLAMAVQAVDAAIDRIISPADGDLTRLDRDDQEILELYSQAEAELKTAYIEARQSAPGMPAYDELVRGT